MTTSPAGNEPNEPLDEDGDPASMNPRSTLDDDPADPGEDPDADPDNMNPRSTLDD
jgi:hypothetical protein